MPSVMSYIIRKSFCFSRISSLSSIQNRSLSYSSSSSFPASSSSLLRKTNAHLDPTKPPFSLLPVCFASSSAEKLKLGKCLDAGKSLDRVLLSAKMHAQGCPDLPQFEIVSNPDDRDITLERKFASESIKVLVRMPKLKEDDLQSQHPQSQVCLVVSIDKGEGRHLEVCCTAYPNEITIHSILMKSKDANEDLAYEGPEFSDLDENLQKDFYKFLEVRGITSSMANSFLEYMVEKEKEYCHLSLIDLKFTK